MSPAIKLFQAFGVELEYMIVDRASLKVLPVADEVIRAVAGAYSSDVERGPVTWSNELVLHVIELKTTDPAPTLGGLREQFQANVRDINRLLEPMGGMLLPTAVHPTMVPERDARLWPHDYSPVYEAFDRVFDCRGHGWSNLQSVHLNLPFDGEEEFGRLHAAIRLLLPILPAIAASSPIVDGKVTPFHDFRLEAYRTNAKRIPSVTGRVIPEPVFTFDAYDTVIFQKMYRDIAPYDPDGLLQHEWLNARGAIARFDRNTIEIRVLDVQECPAVDLALVALVTSLLEAMVDECWTSWVEQRAWDVAPLAEIFEKCLAQSDTAPIDNDAFLRAWGWDRGPCSAAALWRHLYDAARARASASQCELMRPVEIILDQGTLARRMLNRLETASLHDTFTQLAECIEEGHVFGVCP